MPPVTFVGSLCKIHAVVFENCRCSWNKFHDIRTWKFVDFRKIFRFLLNNTRDVTMGGKGNNPPDPESHLGTNKSQQCHKHFFKTVHWLPIDVRFEHGDAKLGSCLRRHLTSLRPFTSRLSSQNGEICLQKYLPISSKLSITNYSKQNALGYRRHLTTESNLKVE